MDKFYDGAKVMLGIAGVIIALLMGSILSLGGEGTVLLMILFYVMGLSIGPRIAFEFASPGLKIYLASGPLGLAFIKLTTKVFLADGEVSQNELKKLKKYLTREFGKEIGIAAEEYIISNPKLSESIFKICTPLAKLKSSQKATIMYQLFAMAASDKLYSKEEEEVLKKIGKYLKISKNRFFYIKSSVIKGGFKEEDGKSSQKKKSHSGKNSKFYQQFFAISSNPYFILGISNNSSNAEIKKAYRELVKKYHPDLSMNKSEQFRKEIMEKVQEINKAYESIKKIRGIK